MKPLVLLSFSLTFLMQGFADGFSTAEPSNQVSAEEHDGDQEIADDSLVVKPNKQVGDEGHNSNFSDAEQPQDTSMPMEPEDSLSEWCLSPYHEMHASIRHNEARGIGYKDGYSTLEAFGIYDGWGSGFMPFVDIRGHIFNNGYLAGNLGIGERTLFTSINHTLGSYLYYDVRRVGHGLTVNQLSPGIELVGERMEYRINGYFPVGKQKGHRYGLEFDKFRGNSIILKSKQQQAMRGFDAEVGVHIPQNTTYDVYVAAGPYYFHSSNSTSWGGRARVLGRYKEYVSLEVAYSYDHLFRSVVQGSIAFTLPFGRKLQRCGPCCPQTDNLLLSRAAFAPSRFEIPVVKKVHKREKAIDPATGLPWTVWFVNNTSHSAGTFESPFPTLLQAQHASSPNDMIYVFPGDGTTNGMDTGITLQDGQTFFGSGIKQQFATTKGSMTIPAFSSSNPTITNTTGNVITIGNGNVISGFNISVVNGNGITNASLVNSTTITNNSFTCIPNGSNGMVLTGFGNFNIYNNQFTAPAANSGGSAIALMSSGGSMNGVINNNTFVGFAGGLFLSPIGESYNFTIEGNTLTNFVSIAMLLAMPGESMLSVIGNTFNGNAGVEGIEVQPGAHPIFRDLVISNNQVVLNSASATNGIFLVTGPLNAVISNNSVQSSKGAGFTGINVTATNSGDICLDLNMNTVVTVPGATAYGFTATTGILSIASIEGNVGGPVASTGAVNFVPAGTCSN